MFPLGNKKYFVSLHTNKSYIIMSAAQLRATERFLEAMGPMVNDEKKMRQVIFFINSMREEKTLPQMSFEELEECVPLDVAFDKLRDKARKYYAAK